MKMITVYEKDSKLNDFIEEIHIEDFDLDGLTKLINSLRKFGVNDIEQSNTHDGLYLVQVTHDPLVKCPTNINLEFQHITNSIKDHLGII